MNTKTRNAEIVAKRQRGVPMRDLCREYNLSYSWVSRITLDGGCFNMRGDEAKRKREAIVAAYVDGDSVKDIAKTFGVTQGHVCNLVRAKHLPGRTAKTRVRHAQSSELAAISSTPCSPQGVA